MLSKAGSFRHGTNQFMLLTVVVHDNAAYSSFVDRVVTEGVPFTLVDATGPVVIYQLRVRHVPDFEKILEECGFSKGTG